MHFINLNQLKGEGTPTPNQNLTCFVAVSNYQHFLKNNAITLKQIVPETQKWH